MELTGDVTSGLPHPLVTETVSGRNMENQKTFEMRKLKQIDR